MYRGVKEGEEGRVGTWKVKWEGKGRGVDWMDGWMDGGM
jgi:hypothetical protein